MKTIKHILLSTIILGLLTFSACGDADTPTPEDDPEQAIIDGLSKAWTVNTATFENGDVTSEWSGFTLTFNQSQGYTATALSDESVLVWPTGGNYTFPNASNPNMVLRQDGVQVSVENLSETTATLSFTITGRSGGRLESLTGDWVFIMEN